MNDSANKTNRDYESLMADMTHIGKNDERRMRWGETIKRKKNTRFGVLRIVAVASTLLLIVLAYSLIKPSSLEDVGTKNLMEIESTLYEGLSFRDPSGSKSSLSKARLAMKKGEYDVAIGHYKGSESVTIPDRMLLSIAHHRSGDQSEAIRTLEEIIKQNNLYKVDAQWLLSNIFLIDENYKKSYDILSRIALSTHPNKRKVDELLKRLKEQK